MSIISQRTDLILSIWDRVKTFPEFDKEFYKEMMKLKESGNNIWFGEKEEIFYRSLANENNIS